MKSDILKSIKHNEAYRSHAYRDSEGVLTIGYGLNLDDGISEPLAAKILEWVVDERTADLKRALPFWGNLSENRQEVFIEMAYNLGMPRFMGFHKMFAAADKGDIETVCKEMENSRWFKQVKSRAARLIEKYREG